MWGAKSALSHIFVMHLVCELFNYFVDFVLHTYLYMDFVYWIYLCSCLWLYIYIYIMLFLFAWSQKWIVSKIYPTQLTSLKNPLIGTSPHAHKKEINQKFQKKKNYYITYIKLNFHMQLNTKKEKRRRWEAFILNHSRLICTLNKEGSENSF